MSKCTAPPATAPGGLGGGGGGAPFGTASPFGQASFGAGSPAASAATGGGAAAPASHCSLEPEPESAFPTSPVTNRVDTSISRDEDEALEHPAFDVDKPCDDESSPTFWMDMCSQIRTDSSQYVNLQKNPERWTGYNGSQVWEAIYSENCLSRSQGELASMCYEERVLYRLLSGMHSSINIHISLMYYPPRKGKRARWEPNPERFWRHFGTHPERLKNLHFAYVVMLRAMYRGSSVLYNMSYDTGAPQDDERTTKLVHRLLDSRILRSCDPVFSAFDESLLFKTEELDAGFATETSSFKRQFKGLFQNISSVLNCVSCQKCKLHGKLQLLGLGSALKMLLLPTELLPTALTRDEVVAFINTLAKFSDAISASHTLTTLYRQQQAISREEARRTERQRLEDAARMTTTRTTTTTTTTTTGRSGIPRRGADPRGVTALVAQTPGKVDEDVHYHGVVSLVDRAVGAIAELSKTQRLSPEEEEHLVRLALARDVGLLVVTKHYASRLDAFLRHARVALSGAPSAMDVPPSEPGIDVVVVGGGLAGMSAALTLLDRGARVVLVEKEPFLGGNSAWASSGINSVSDEDPQRAKGDSVRVYAGDTLKSADGTADEDLVRVLTAGSGPALEWIRSRVQLDLNDVGQLGGHSFPRTYRPSDGMAGSKLVFALQKALKPFEKQGQLRLLKRATLSQLVIEDGRVAGIEVQVKEKGAGASESQTLRARHGVVLATGGFANDRKGDGSLIHKFRPDLEGLATTNGRWATGDGHKVALGAGAATVDMNYVQVHPTAFVDPEDPTAERKTLCAELLRGAGGILLDRQRVARFVDELQTRDFIVGEMKKQGDEPVFMIVLTEAAAQVADKHISLYTQKGLVRKLSLQGLADWAGWKVADLQAALREYNAAAEEGKDAFGKSVFNNAPFPVDADGVVYAGLVTPALHYTMGGLKVQAETARVLRPDGEWLQGLYAAGEIVGGVHGKNRLGGNALTECVVFGRLVGQGIALDQPREQASGGQEQEPAPQAAEQLRTISAEELARHNSPTDCWVAIFGKVYDFTDFLEEHPAGPEAVLEYAGADGSDKFRAVHNAEMLEDFDPIGVFEG